MQDTARAEGLSGQLGDHFPAAHCAQVQNHGSPPILIKHQSYEELFKTLHHVWDVSSGCQYLLDERSEFCPDRGEKPWREEAHILRQISHDHVVKLLKDTYDPWPQLYLEGPFHRPLSRLKLSVQQCEMVLSQCLSALAYLHAKNPPMDHGELKPEDILVYDLEDNRIHVKLSDFAVTRAHMPWVARRGTSRYQAPEFSWDELYEPPA
ncbi:hypothetical protein E4U41_004807 [Claviceps citrina]|nr:hypothetical protein E4U41_004807 [Claviceps citrina]